MLAPLKLALHRSFTFWSGVLVMAFVCWAWWDSSLRITSATFRRYSFISGARGIALNWDQGFSLLPPSMDREPLVPSDDDASLFPPPRFERGAGHDMMAEFSKYVDRQDDHWIPNTPEALRAMGARWGNIDAYFGSMRYQKVGDWRIFIPYWIILLAAAAPWLALLFLRVQRMKKSASPA